MSVLVLHADAAERERLVAELRARGLDAIGVSDVDGALDAADRTPVRVVAVQPEILLEETMDVGTRIGVRSGQPPKVVALTHLADPARKKAFAEHGATLLARPADDLDSLASTLTALSVAAAAVPVRDPSLGKMKVERLARTPDEPLDAPPRADGNPTLAVIVDDDEAVRDLLRDILAPRGYAVETFASANAALRWLAKSPAPVSVILSDLQLPQMDGFELKSSLPASVAGVPYFLVTAEATPEHQQIAASLGVKAVIPKPLQARALCKIVREAILSTPAG